MISRSLEMRIAISNYVVIYMEEKASKMPIVSVITQLENDNFKIDSVLLAFRVYELISYLYALSKIKSVATYCL